MIMPQPANVSRKCRGQYQQAGEFTVKVHRFKRFFQPARQCDCALPGARVGEALLERSHCELAQFSGLLRTVMSPVAIGGQP
jgi:hypothetical protein